MRTTASVMCAGVALVLFSVATCGGRNLENDDDGILAAGGSGGGGGADGGTGGTAVGGAEPTGGAGGVEPSGSGGATFNPIDCIGCVTNECPETLECIQNPTCVQGLGCAVQNCLAGGSPDFMCAVDCFDGNISEALQALNAIQCVFSECSDVCGTDALPFPGLPGGP